MNLIQVKAYVDADTGIFYWATGDSLDNELTSVYPQKLTTVISDYRDNRVLVSPAGSLQVENRSPITEDFIVLTKQFNLAKNGTRDILESPGEKYAIWIYGMIGTTDSNGTVAFIDSLGGVHSGTMPIMANSGFVMPISPNKDMPWIKCARNSKFQATLGTNSDLDGIVIYALVKEC